MQTQTHAEIEGESTLAGRRVALARAAEEAHTPAAALRALGAEVIYYPCLEMLPPDNLAEFDRALERLAAADYDWLLLTTASAVMSLADRLAHLQIAPSDLSKAVNIALYGTTTRLAAQDLLDLDSADQPEADSHAAWVDALPIAAGSQVLLPLPAGSRADWPNLLRQRGAQVTTVAAYRAHMGHGGDELPALLWSGDVNAIVFNSENNVRYFARRLHYEGGTLAMLDDVCIACIEPQTAAVARALGLHVHVVPADHSDAGLAAALADCLAHNNRF
jgi:uroporphyrinogen-III synthase